MILRCPISVSAFLSAAAASACRTGPRGLPKTRLRCYPPAAAGRGARAPRSRNGSTGRHARAAKAPRVAAYGPMVIAIQIGTRCGILWPTWPQESQSRPLKCLGVSDRRALRTANWARMSMKPTSATAKLSKVPQRRLFLSLRRKRLPGIARSGAAAVIAERRAIREGPVRRLRSRTDL
jgi:hypothetical protein